VRLIVTATATDTPPLGELSLDVRGHTKATESPAARTTDVFFGDGFQPTPIVARKSLIGEEPRQGPLIVESIDTTVVVPPGWVVESDAVGILELRRTGQQASSEAAAGAAAAN
jgi:N-methylhydantoinase A